MEYIIKDLPIDSRPRERLKKYGSKNLSDEELLAIIIRSGTKEHNALNIAREILIKNKLKDITDSSLNSLSKIKGLGEVKAITLLASLELGRRSLNSSSEEKIKITTSNDAFNLVYKDMYNLKQEELLVIFLDIKNYVIKKKTIFIGTVNQSTVHPRDIFREAIYYNAVSLIICHNHPSGVTKPSYNDDLFTNNLLNIGKIMGINVIDHLIIGNNTYYSYRESGMI